MTVSFWSRAGRLLVAAIPMLCSAASYKVTDLGTLGGSESIATAINATGEITGGATTAAGAYHAFLYSNGSMKDLGTLGGPSSQGQSINGVGTVAGYAQLPPGTVQGGWPPHPVSLYSAFVDSNGTMTAVGTPGGAAYGINDAGQVIGECSGGACLFSGGSVTNLGSLGGTSGQTQATAINSSAEVVGYSYLPDGNFRGFFWINGTMTAMGTLGGDWSQAYGINDAGQITGEGLYNGQLSAFLLTDPPAGPAEIAAVPEPSELVMVGAILAVAGLWRTRRLRSGLLLVRYLRRGAPNRRAGLRPMGRLLVRMSNRHSKLEPEGIADRPVFYQHVFFVLGDEGVLAEVIAELGPECEVAAAVAVPDDQAVLKVVRHLPVPEAIATDRQVLRDFFHRVVLPQKLMPGLVIGG